MKSWAIITAIGACLILLAFTIRPKQDSTRYVRPTIDFVKQHALLFAASAGNLQTVISKINKEDTSSLLRAKEALKNCRAQYKSI